MQAAATSSEAASAGEHKQDEQMIEVKVGERSYTIAKNVLNYFGMIEAKMRFEGNTGKVDLTKSPVSPKAFEQLIQIAALARRLQIKMARIERILHLELSENQPNPGMIHQIHHLLKTQKKLSLQLADAIQIDGPEELTQLLQAADFLLLKEPIMGAFMLGIASVASERQLSALIDFVHQKKGQKAPEFLPHIAKHWWLGHNRQLADQLSDVEFGVSVQDLIDHDLVPQYDWGLTQRIDYPGMFKEMDLSGMKINSLNGLQNIEGIERCTVLFLNAINFLI